MNKNIMKLKEKLTQIGPFHPGKITKQLVKCGKKNCKCQDTQNPQKHGPYFMLSYANGKKNSTVFLKQDEVQLAKKWLSEFEQFKKTSEDLVNAYIQLAKDRRWNTNDV